MRHSPTPPRSGARTFAEVLATVARIEIAGRTVICLPVVAGPDFNIVCMAFNVAGNEDLDRMNALNREIYHRFSYEYGSLYQDDWITSHTVLGRSVDGDVPRDFTKHMGIPEAEWDRVGGVDVLRSCVMHPWIAHDTTYPERWQTFLAIIAKLPNRPLSNDFSEQA